MLGSNYTRCYAEEAVEDEFTAFDIYLADSFRGISAVKFSENSFTFDNIDDVIGLLPIGDEKEKVRPLLEGAIPTNRELENVGTVKFDPNTFKVVITLDAELLKSKTIDNKIEVTKQDAKRALRQDLRFTHVEADGSNSALSALTYLSLGAPWLKAEYSFSQDQGTTVRETSLNMLYRDYKLAGGIIRNASHRLLPNVDIFGSSVLTSQHNFNEQNNVRGSYFQVFVPSKARVEFYREGQFIDMQFLDFGLQEVDTTRFPDGSYYVDVVINELSGGTSKQRLFYTKSGLLAPRGHPLISLEGGVVRDQLKALDMSVVSASLDWRIFKSAQIELATFDCSVYQIHTAGLRFLYDGFNLGSTIGMDNENERSYSVDLSGQIMTVGMGVTYERSKFVRFEQEKKSAIPQQFADFVVESADDLAEDDSINEVLNGYLTKSISDIEFRIQGFSSLTKKKNSYRYGPAITYSLRPNPTNQWILQASFVRSEVGDNLNMLLGYQHLFDEYKYETNGGFKMADGRKDYTVANALNYDSVDAKSGLGTRARLQNDTVKNDSTAGTTTSIQAEHGGYKYGVAGFGQNSVNENGVSRPAVGINANTSLVVLENGKTVLAPSSLGESLLVITINTNSSDVDMEILVDGNVASRLKGGGTIVVGVTPYKKYRTAIKPASGSVLVSYDSDSHEFALFPGDVAQVDFSADKVFVAMAKIVDINNKPIKLKRLKGKKVSVLTDDTGFFQTEISGPEQLRIESKSTNCIVDVPDVGDVKYYHDYGTLVCR
ncbi:MAG: TcfC E-set like domain-containing protein [Proteobacteria bacterium]|nr:TcfC E-set like domain-containing protein [Pseudomonadota bacterium]